MKIPFSITIGYHTQEIECDYDPEDKTIWVKCPYDSKFLTRDDALYFLVSKMIEEHLNDSQNRPNRS